MNSFPNRPPSERAPGPLTLLLVHDSPKVVGTPRLLAEIERLRRQGKRVVFTDGCFDILHRSTSPF